MKLQLRDYQQEAHTRTAEAEARGVRRQLGVAATGLGKALADSEVVLTPTGWRAISTLRVGDFVIGGDGAPTEVVGVYPQGERGLFRVTFSDGPEVVCTEDHLWTVRDKYAAHRGSPWRTIPLRDFRHRLDRAWRVPLCAPVEGSDDGVTVDPYLLGLLLGDGSLTRGLPYFTTADPELVEAVTAALPAGVFCDHAGGYDYRLTGRRKNTPNPLTVMLRDLGMMGHGSADKYVPDAYKHASPTTRAAVLAGLLDADGHVRPSDGHIEFTTVSPRLAQDTAHLARSLGGTCRVHRRPGSYRLSFAFPPGFAPFRLARKAAVVRDRTKYLPTRRVVKVEQLPSGHATCIKVANPDGLFVTRGYVVTHNTVIFASMAERRGGRTLVLAHRDELITQAAAKVLEVWPELGATETVLGLLLGSGDPELVRLAGTVRRDHLGVGIVKAGADDVRATVVVASVQTLSRDRRLAKLVNAMDPEASMLRPVEPFGLVVVDEAHHAAADSYRKVLDALRAGDPGCMCGEPHERMATPDEVDDGCELGVAYDPCPMIEPGPLLLGVTATPDRGDGKGLDDLFGEIVWQYDMLWGIRSGYLSELRGLRVELDRFDLDRVKVSRGDYDAGQAGRAMEAAGAPQVIVQAWLREHQLGEGETITARGRKTLVFTPTVEMATHVAAEFVAQGVRAGWVSGETPTDQRRAILRAFKQGELDVLANCAVLTEGYDEPAVSCVVVARPTKSRALYTQMVGRGTRRHPDKTECLVLDVVGASAQHSLVTVPSLFGIDPKVRPYREGEPLTRAATEQEQELVKLGRLSAEEADLFQQVRREGLAWVPIHRQGDPLRRYIISGGKDRDTGTERPMVVLAQREPDDVWTAGLQFTSGEKRVLIANVTMETAQGVAEDYVRRKNPHGLNLVDANAAWRKRKPSAKALKAAKAWRITVDPTWNAGQLSDAMNAHIGRIKANPRKRKTTPS